MHAMASIVSKVTASSRIDLQTSSCSEPALCSGDRPSLRCHTTVTCLAKHFSTALSCTNLRFLVLLRICIILYTARSKAVREHYTSGECRLDFYIFKSYLEFHLHTTCIGRDFLPLFTNPPSSPDLGAAGVLASKLMQA